MIGLVPPTSATPEVALPRKHKMGMLSVFMFDQYNTASLIAKP